MRRVANAGAAAAPGQAMHEKPLLRRGVGRLACRGGTDHRLAASR